jgi:outer membrane lipopolysaccharide assembly protein LptE/RlpB
MSYDSTLALAKEREQRAVEELLAKELTQQVLRHLNSVSVAVSSGR